VCVVVTGAGGLGVVLAWACRLCGCVCVDVAAGVVAGGVTATALVVAPWVELDEDEADPQALTATATTSAAAGIRRFLIFLSSLLGVVP
jgi:hypothetical protein